MSEIRDLLFDLDDTFIKTRVMFRKQMYEVYSILALSIPGVSISKIKYQFEDLNNKAVETHQVNPERWGVVLEQFGCLYPNIDRRTLSRCHDTLMRIYEIVPEKKMMAKEVLKFLEDRGFRNFLVTHSSPEWADFKLERTGLKPFFQDRVFVCDMNLPKNEKSWLLAMEKFNVNPRSVCAIGDSKLTDMTAAHNAGITNLFHIVDPNQWIVHEVDLNFEHTPITGVHRLPDALRKQGILNQ